MNIRASFALIVSLACLVIPPSVLAQDSLKGIDAAAIAFSANGKLLAAAGTVPHKAGVSRNVPMPGLVKVWEVGTGKQVFRYVDERWAATSLSFSPKAPLLAVGFNDRPRGEVLIEKGMVTVTYDEKIPPVPVKIWDLKTSKEYRCLLHDEERSNLDNVKSVSFSADGGTVAVGNFKAHFWDVEKGKKEFSLSAGWSGVSSVVMSPDKKVAAVLRWSASSGGAAPSEFAVELLDLQTKKATAVFPASDECQILAFSADGSLLALPGLDANTVRICNVGEQKIIATLEAHSARAMSVVFSADSKNLYTGGFEKKGSAWKIWTLPNGRLLHTQECPLTSTNVLAVSPDGQKLATGGREGTVRIWPIPKK